MRVLVCGGRDFTDKAALYRALDAVHRKHGITDLIEGEAPGADSLAREWALEAQVCLLPFPADWKTHGRAAGPIRNARMLAEGKPDAVVAFPGGRGTADMVRQAKEAGIPVWEVSCSSRSRGADTPARSPDRPGAGTAPSLSAARLSR